MVPEPRSPRPAPAGPALLHEARFHEGRRSAPDLRPAGQEFVEATPHTPTRDVPGRMVPPDLETALRERFGHGAFRPGQRAVIESVFAGEHALVVRPTGSGKSVCYQLPALYLPGTTIVVSPLISLMKDQVDRLRSQGIPAVAVHSGLGWAAHHEALDAIRAGHTRLVFAAPERFRNPRFLDALQGLRVSLLAVDEAHCVSRWGHDFRPDYRRLAEARRLLGDPVTMALTATATERVQRDILEQLGLPSATVFVSGFERPNLFLEVLAIRRRAEKDHLVADLVRTLPSGAAIVYCPTRRQATELAGTLGGPQAGVGLYHAGLEDTERRAVQEAFMAGRLRALCATNAFGMGIDRADIRLIVHYALPGSVESYYQQCGRAGRDGEPARCVLLYSYADRAIHDFFIDAQTPPAEVVRATWNALDPAAGDGPRQLDRPTLVARARAAAPVPARASGDSGRLRRRPGWLAVEGALRLLEHAGRLVRRGQDAVELRGTTGDGGGDGETGGGGGETGSGGGEESGTEETDALGIDWSRAFAFQDAERDRLRQMVSYAKTAACRSAAVLRYFHDPDARRGGCDHCDVCVPDRSLAATLGSARRPEGALLRPPGDDARTVARKVLSCVYRMRGTATRTGVALCLAGSRSQATRESGHHRLSTFGLLRPLSQADVRAWVDALAREQLLRRHGGRVALTRRGAQVMVGRAPLPDALRDTDIDDGSRAGGLDPSGGQTEADLDPAAPPSSHEGRGDADLGLQPPRL